MRLKSGLMMVALACASPAWAALSPPSTALAETFISYNTAGSNPRCPGGVSCRPYGTPKTWVAPVSGIYTLTLAGGEGGGFMSLDQYDPGIEGSQFLDPNPGGRGAIVSGNYRIAAGTKLVIIAAQAGAQTSGFAPGFTNLFAQGGGGGGGSFVFTVPDFVVGAESITRGSGYDLSQGTLLAAAGGGGGAGPSYYNPIPNHGLAGRNGGSSQYLDQESAINLGGVDGGAGKDRASFDTRGVITYYQQIGGSAGASFREAADGLTGGNSAEGFFNGSGFDVVGRPRIVNGVSAAAPLTGVGGYGGGGSGGWLQLGYVADNIGWTGGGGGGGYSGGAGGMLDSNGGGGGSYIADDATWLYGLDGANAGNGWVSINFLSAVPEPSNWAMLIAGFGLTGAAMRRRRFLVAA